MGRRKNCYSRKKCHDSCDSFKSFKCKNKKKKCRKVIPAHLTATLGDDVVVGINEAGTIGPGDIPFKNLIVTHNIGFATSTSTTPETTFTCQVDGAYRISYSLQILGSGWRIITGIIKNNAGGAGIPGSISTRFFPQTALEGEATVDKSFIVELRKGDVLHLQFIANSFNQGQETALLTFEGNSSISFNKI